MRAEISAIVVSITLGALVLPGCGEATGPDPGCPAVDPPPPLDLAPCASSDSLCTRYLSIWESELMTRNGMTQSWFERHITVRSARFDTWNDGISFRVIYSVRIAWASIDENDMFIVFLTPSAPYPPGPLPRNVYLDAEEVALALDSGVSNSAINRINPLEQLAFCSEAEALTVLRAMAGTQQMEVQRYRYWGGFRPQANGNPYLEGFAVIDFQANECASGSIDLATGEGEAHDTACWATKQGIFGRSRD